MSNINKRIEFNNELNKLFLNHEIDKMDCGPTSYSILDFISQYEPYLFKNEVEPIKKHLLFLVQYISFCKHCAREIDWILVERIIPYIAI